MQSILQKIFEQGDIYKKNYEGWYCVPCESYWLERQLVDGKCPDCGRPVERMEEESYFFKLPNIRTVCWNISKLIPTSFSLWHAATR